MLLVAACALVSCEAEITPATMPVFRGFDMTFDGEGDIPQPGDIITVTAVQTAVGNRIYNAQYDWTMATVVNGKPDTVRWTKKVVYSRNTANPTVRYQVPAGNNGYLNVSLYATYDFSTRCTDPVTTIGHDKGNITASSSNLFGRVSGNLFNIRIGN